jgi:hypothetical protein
MIKSPLNQLRRALYVALALALMGFTLCVALFVSAERADAHYLYGRAQANQQVYNVYQSHCGNGTTWFCVNRNVFLSSYEYGVHSYYVNYRWAEQNSFYPPRECQVAGRVEHGAFVQVMVAEYCG